MSDGQRDPVLPATRLPLPRVSRGRRCSPRPPLYLSSTNWNGSPVRSLPISGRPTPIARIDPATGQVSGWIDLTGLLSDADRRGSNAEVLNGIAYRPPRASGCSVTGKWWPKLYQSRTHIPFTERYTMTQDRVPVCIAVLTVSDTRDGSNRQVRQAAGRAPSKRAGPHPTRKANPARRHLSAPRPSLAVDRRAPASKPSSPPERPPASRAATAPPRPSAYSLTRKSRGFGEGLSRAVLR